MSRRDDAISLKDMLDHAREAVELLGETGSEVDAMTDKNAGVYPEFGETNTTGGQLHAE